MREIKVPEAPAQDTLIGAYRALQKLSDEHGRDLYFAERVRPEGPATRVLLEVVWRSSPRFALEKDALMTVAAMLGERPHPNWVSLIDAGEEAAGCYIAVEVVDGWSLDKLIGLLRMRQLVLPIEAASWVVLEILRGAGAMLASRPPREGDTGLIPGEMRPSNVLISRTGSVKLSHLTGEINAPSAVYAAGAIMYELLTGTPLVNEDSGTTVPSRELGRLDLPDVLVKIVMRATNEQPLDRYNHPGDMADDLEQWLMRDGRSFTPAAVERFFRDPFAPSSRPTARRLPLLDANRNVQEKRTLPIIVGLAERAPSNRAPSLALPRQGPRRRAHAAPKVHTGPVKTAPRGGLVAKLILLSLLVGLAAGFYIGLWPNS